MMPLVFELITILAIFISFFECSFSRANSLDRNRPDAHDGAIIFGDLIGKLAPTGTIPGRWAGSFPATRST
jgi:hypothetical protein